MTDFNLTKCQHMAIFQVQKINIDGYQFYGWCEDHLTNKLKSTSNFLVIQYILEYLLYW